MNPTLLTVITTLWAFTGLQMLLVWMKDDEEPAIGLAFLTFLSISVMALLYGFYKAITG